MPFNVSEEQNLLASMITERDAQISSLTHQLHSTSEILHSTQKELQQKSSARKSQREDHSATIKKLKEEHSEQRRILAKFEQNVKSGGGLRVHEYAALMRSANSNQVESSYVIRLQAQLCRAMHSLGVMESQLALVKENCSSLIKFMKEDLSHMVDDRTRREIELMNGLAKVDNEKHVMAEEMESKIQEKEELLDQVREEYEELGLEYDENEVKRALEVKYLLEQMEKVKEDKIRLEKELLSALLEREEQINMLRGEAEELDKRFDGLKKDAERRDIQRRQSSNVVNFDGEIGVPELNGDEGDAEGEGGQGSSDEEETTSSEDNHENEGDGGEGEEARNVTGKQEEEIIADVTSQLENTTMGETPPSEEAKPGVEEEEVGNADDGTDGDQKMEGTEEAPATEEIEEEEAPAVAPTTTADVSDEKAEDPLEELATDNEVEKAEDEGVPAAAPTPAVVSDEKAEDPVEELATDNEVGEGAPAAAPTTTAEVSYKKAEDLEEELAELEQSESDEAAIQDEGEGEQLDVPSADDTNLDNVEGGDSKPAEPQTPADEVEDSDDTNQNVESAKNYDETAADPALVEKELEPDNASVPTQPQIDKPEKFEEGGNAKEGEGEGPAAVEKESKPDDADAVDKTEVAADEPKNDIVAETEPSKGEA